MVILYLHGMASSHDCRIAASIRRHLPEVEMIVPDLSIDPEVAFPQIDRILVERKVDLIIGHSLGGFMAQKYRGYSKLLINPSLGVSYFQLLRGKNRYKYPRYDGVQSWYVDGRICRCYKEMEHKQYEGLDDEERGRTWAVFGRCDILTRLSSRWYLQHYTQRQMIPGDHYPKDQTVRDYIAPLCRKILQIKNDR